MNKTRSTRGELMSSPLKHWQKTHCENCGRHCDPNSGAFLACALVYIAESVHAVKEFIKIEGAHLR